MKVLFLMFAFGDMNKTFNMYTALVEQFHLNGHDVVVVAPCQDQQKSHISTEKGVDILRVKTLSIKNVSNWRKGISNLLLPYQYGRVIRKFYPIQKFDLIVVPTPPITLIDLASSLKKRSGAKLYLMLRDIFPQNAVDLGFMRQNSIIHNYFRHKEQKLYRTADFIGCMSQGNIDYILKHNRELAVDKFHILRNFQYKYEGFGFNKEALKQKYGIEGKFVLLFGGNMGRAQELDNVLALAQRAMKYPDVTILLLGEGVMMQRTEKQIQLLGINNINIHGAIPKQEYQDLLGICDVGIISLHRDFTIPNIPSKSLDYWNVGLPILASIDRATDYDRVLEESGAGLYSYAGDDDKFFANFNRLYSDAKLRGEMSASGKKYFNTYLTPDIAYKLIMSKIDHE